MKKENCKTPQEKKKKKKMRQDRLNFKQIRSACENKYN